MTKMQRINKTHSNYMLPYVAFWFAIAIAFEGLYAFSPGFELFNAVSTGIQIIGTAALLGFGALHVALRAPMPREKPMIFGVAHIIGAFFYSLFWLISVISLNKIGTVGPIKFDVAEEFIVRWHLIAGPVLYFAIVIGVIAVRSVELTQKKLRDAELQVIRAKLNPHFLFNTLHTIMVLFRSDADKGEKAMEQFSDLIRYSFHNDNSSISETGQEIVALENEWAIGQKYLELEQLRLGENLVVSFDIDPDALRFKAPQLLLQPLFENAIIHGISKLEGGGKLEIIIKKYGDEIVIRILNDCLGDEVDGEQDGSGLGLLAVEASLESVFGKNASLSTQLLADSSFQVTITMPAEEIGNP